MLLSIHVALNHVTHYRYDRPGSARAAADPVAPGAAQPHPHPVVFPTHHAGRTFHQLATGPGSELPGARGRAGPNHASCGIEIDLVAEMAVLNPFDFFLDDYAEHFPFDYQPAERRELAPYLVTQAPRLASASTWPGCRAQRVRTIDFLVGLNQRLAKRYPLSDPDGARRADPGANTRQCVRLVS